VYSLLSLQQCFVNRVPQRSRRFFDFFGSRTLFKGNRSKRKTASRFSRRVSRDERRVRASILPTDRSYDRRLRGYGISSITLFGFLRSTDVETAAGANLSTRVIRVRRISSHAARPLGLLDINSTRHIIYADDRCRSRSPVHSAVQSARVCTGWC